jgi:phage terminase small subunit
MTAPLLIDRFFLAKKGNLTMPRPTRNRQRKPRPPLPQDVATAAQTKGLSPLAYMLAVMRNPKTSQRRRDRMAVTAARYIHARPADSIGKKNLLAEAAREAGGDEWADDLDGDWRQ